MVIAAGVRVRQSASPTSTVRASAGPSARKISNGAASSAMVPPATVSPATAITDAWTRRVLRALVTLSVPVSSSSRKAEKNSTQ